MLRNRRKTLACIAICLVATVAGLLVWHGVRRSPANRVYRIGWDSDPPYQAIDANGQPTGLAIELVREGARRRGVRLEWIRQPAAGTVPALRDGKLDLWPLLAITPERQKSIYFSEPYLEGAHCFLVRADSPYTKTQDLAGALISHNSIPINVRNLHLTLPNARFLAYAETTPTMESVCQNRADAAFVEEYAAVAALLGGLSCSGEKLRLVPAPEIQPRMSVASSFASSAIADAIRDGIGEVASDSELPPALRRWSYFSRRNIESLQNLQEAKRVQRLLTILVGVLFGLLLTAGWLTLRTLRAQKKARRAERELGVTQRNYRLLAEEAAEGVFQIDHEGRFLVVNSRICEMLGYTAEELRRMTVLETYFPEELESGRQRLAEVFSGAGARLERTMRRKDGTGVPVEASVMNLGDGRAQAIVHDISDRVNAEAALRESEERLRLAQQAARVGSFEWNMRTGVNRWTPELEEIYGLPPGGFRGSQDAWEELVHPDDLAQVKRRLDLAMQSSELVRQELFSESFLNPATIVHPS
jgi:PAS domain S-box-containing protein